MKYLITILIICLVGCLPLEPEVTGIFVTYNFCLHPIEVKNTELSDNYENTKISTIDVNTQKIAKSFSSEEPIVQAKKIYFLENRVKKNFKIDIYREREIFRKTIEKSTALFVFLDTHQETCAIKGEYEIYCYINWKYFLIWVLVSFT